MPDTREKLSELIAIGGFFSRSVDAERCVDHLIANGVTLATDNNVAYKLKATEPLTNCQQWIPVTERLPDGECIAIGFQNEMLIGYVYADAYSDTLYTAESDGEVLRNVTHWMPLPEPPKEVK